MLRHRACASSLAVALLVVAIGCRAPSAPPTEFARTFNDLANRAVNAARGLPLPPGEPHVQSQGAQQMTNSQSYGFPVEELQKLQLDTDAFMARVAQNLEREIVARGLTVDPIEKPGNGTFVLRYRGLGRMGSVRGMAQINGTSFDVGIDMSEDPAQ
jgi:hypothetical protein